MGCVFVNVFGAQSSLALAKYKWLCRFEDYFFWVKSDPGVSQTNQKPSVSSGASDFQFTNWLSQNRYRKKRQKNIKDLGNFSHNKYLKK